MIRHSHERWDGDGYPDGIAGDEIPLGSRVIFCADAFHAIRSDRPYRKGSPAPEALAEVKRNAGSQFDPEAVEALEEVVRRLKLPPAASGFRSSSRLVALLLALVVGAGGTAIAKSGLLGSASADGPSGAGPAACVSDCVTPFGASLAATLEKWGSNPTAARGSESNPSGSTPADPPAPGSPPGVAGAGLGPPASDPAPSTGGGSTSPQGGGGSGGGSGSGGNDTGGGGSGGDRVSPGGGGSGGGSSGGGSSSGHPHGGPPGQTGNHPLGGPPGQTGNHPQGGPPGQAKKD
jgi:hypothetical protein